jgi:carbamoyltransferase
MVTYGRYGPAYPQLGKLAYWLNRPIYDRLFAWNQFYRPESAFATRAGEDMRAKLAAGKPVYLLGLGPGGHNSGAALLRVTADAGIEILSNNEEERFTGIKHCAAFPDESLAALKQQMQAEGITPADLHACLSTWRYMEFMAFGLRLVAEHLPHSVALLRPSAASQFNYLHALSARQAPAQLARSLGLPGRFPIIATRHHDTHAYFSYGCSPFADSEEPVMVTVLDGYGDDGAISLYTAKSGELTPVYQNGSMFDSLGVLYSVISSTQGGWTILSSEGRYMGATAWGNNDRLTNPFYRRLRQLVYFGESGQVFLNRAIGRWHLSGEHASYSKELESILGPAIAQKDMWNPDAVLRVEDTAHSAITQERLDKAAAMQLLFEDVLFHIVEHMIRTTGSDKLVMTGGTALNCIANMRLLEHFDEKYYQRYVGRKTRLQLWVPPTPGDAGAPLGAAYAFAMKNGVRPRTPMRHAFYCGSAPAEQEIVQALEQTEEIEFAALGNISDAPGRSRIADYAALVVSRDGVLGIYQGCAETGPRALGHRSIVANPCNPRTLENINAMVKFRERIRPLAPMATREAALKLFELSPGAAADDYNAYNYMVLAARAREEARALIPAVIHHDGTGRVQIVRPDIDPFMHAFLKAMGRRVGVEVAVNTSLNVGSPIVQTPAQALDVLKRSKGLSGLIMIGAAGDVYLAWHTVVRAPKDGGRALNLWLREWQDEAQVETAEAPALS